jgi:hypothetical protein
MKSIYIPNDMGWRPGSDLNWLYKPQEIAHPRPKGRIIPASPTLNATLQFDLNNRMSTSRATRNKNSIRPKFATRVNIGIEAVGKMAFWKPGIRIITDGPRIIPPMTSAITLGWRSLERGKWSRRQKIIMMPAY